MVQVMLKVSFIMTELLPVLVCSDVYSGRWSRIEFIVELKSVGRQVCNIESLSDGRVRYELNLGTLVVPFMSTHGERGRDIINTKIQNCKHP